MSFNKVTSNKNLSVGMKFIIFIFILWQFYKNMFQSCSKIRNGERMCILNYYFILKILLILKVMTKFKYPWIWYKVL